MLESVVVSYRKLKTALSTSLIVLYISISSLHADDTEIFFGAQSSNASSYPNVLFVLDTSGSMDLQDNTGSSRIARMKDAVHQILDSATNVNVGMMRFNGSGGGGAVLYPITYIDQDLCPNGVCNGEGDVIGDVPLSYRIESSDDDVTENLGDLSIRTADPVLNLFKSDQLTVNDATDIYTITSSLDFAEENISGSHWSNSDDLDTFYDRYEIFWGLRIQNIVIPDDATLTKAFLRFHAKGSWPYQYNAVSANIFTEDTLSSPNYSNTSVSDRNLLSTPIEWDIDLPTTSNNNILDTPDLSGMLEQLIARPDFNSGQSDIGFIFKNNGIADDSHRRTLYSPKASSSSLKPQLHVTYTEQGTNNEQLGLRFNNIKVPQGATITQASITFTSESSSSSTTSATIHAQDVGSSEAFSSSNGDLSSRTKTNAVTNWEIPSWGIQGEQYNTDDISNVIQEVVSRSDWCGGNSLSLLLNGTGVRKALSYDHDPSNAPVLKLTYDASTIPSGGGCTTARAVSSISTNNDDATETNTGAVIRNNKKLFIPRKYLNQYLTGLRFQNIVVPKNATITDARLTLTAVKARSSNTSWSISAENNGNSAEYTNVTHSLSNRSKSSSTVDWDLVNDITKDKTLTSPNLKSLITSVTSRNDWASGNALSLFLERKSGTGNRVLYSYDNQPLKAAKLEIFYEIAPGTLAPESQDQVVYLSTRQKLKQILDDMDTSGGTPIVESLYEAANYFQGNAVEFGKTRGYKSGNTDYRDSRHRISHSASYVGGNVTKDKECTTSNYSHSSCETEKINGKPVYTSPINDSCQTNHIVLLTDGEPSNSLSLDGVHNMIGTTNCVDEDGGTCGEELLSYLNTNDQSDLIDGTQEIITHTVGFNFSSQWLQDLSTAGGGTYYTADTSSQLVNAFNNILASILKVDTSFVAPGATVNQFNRLTHSNELYLSLFKPNDRPTWTGNLKKYWLTGSPAMLTDVDGKPAVNEATGFFNEDIKSGWSTVVDGSTVELGGAAGLLDASNRRVFTYTGSNRSLSHSSNQLHEFNYLLSKSMFDVDGQSNTYYNNLLKWSRGIDINDDDDDGSTTDSRTHMGDPLHSQPLIITGESTNDTTIYMATNEGYLHSFDHDGKERWSFVPPDLLPNLDIYYQNSPSVNHPYGLDGHLYRWTDDSTNKSYLVMGMRRGGNKYYSLDITDKNNPKMAWTLDPETQTDFANMGQTWSQPIPGAIKLNGVKTKVLIIAGGYDENQDTAPIRSEDSMGNIIYIINPVTGALIWSGGGTNTNSTKKFADMKYSMPATVKAIDIDFDGYTDQMYIGDMGGQIWRFDIDNYSTNSADLVKGGVLARISDDSVDSARRFFYSPDVALIKDNHQSYLSIAIGSGWRSHPLNRSIDDRFYILHSTDVYSAPKGYGKDDGNGNYSIITESDLVDVTDDQSPSLSGEDGFFLRLERSGEKVLAKSITVKGKTIFTTYLPDPPVTTCASALGGGYVYVINTTDGSAALDLNNSGDDELTKEDRDQGLSRAGIPSEAVVIFPSGENNGSEVDPVVIVGTEKLFDTANDELTPRTFWQQTSE